MSDPMEMDQGAGSIVGGALFGSGGSMSAESMGKMSSSADALVASARSGGFTVTKEAADPIIKVLEKYIDEVGSMRLNMNVFDKAPPLGDHPYGKKMAHYMYVAANDDQSARAALETLEGILKQSREVLLWASNQYQEQEEEALDVFRKFGD